MRIFVNNDWLAFFSNRPWPYKGTQDFSVLEQNSIAEPIWNWSGHLVQIQASTYL
jgi:hypothetical protein